MHGTSIYIGGLESFFGICSRFEFSKDTKRLYQNISIMYLKISERPFM